MVSVSREWPVESERRLRAIATAAEIVHLDGLWCFRRVEGEMPADALAMVRDADGLCAVVPATQATAEPFGVTMTTFAPGVDNSGWIGWLATAIKQQAGSGVFVICGDNPRRGGIFDYLGYPANLVAEIRRVIDEIGGAGEPLDLDVRLFEVVECSPASAISPDTRFEFRESSGIVEATYAGGQIVRGLLVGTRTDDLVTTAYAQLHVNGELRTGKGEMRIERMPDGRLSLTERYTWSDGTEGSNVLCSVD
jgi:hypothetical protein